jgi:hypothetical protein
MPKLRTESFGSGDQSWLGSSHGIRNARTGTIDISTFTAATHFPDGYIRSGTPVNAASEASVKPYTGAAGEQLGFVLFDQKVEGTTDLPAAILRHGTINVPKLPIAGFAAGDAGAGGFVLIGGGN